MHGYNGGMSNFNCDDGMLTTVTVFETGAHSSSLHGKGSAMPRAGSRQKDPSDQRHELAAAEPPLTIAPAQAIKHSLKRSYCHLLQTLSYESQSPQELLPCAGECRTRAGRLQQSASCRSYFLATCKNYILAIFSRIILFDTWYMCT